VLPSPATSRASRAVAPYVRARWLKVSGTPLWLMDESLRSGLAIVAKNGGRHVLPCRSTKSDRRGRLPEWVRIAAASAQAGVSSDEEARAESQACVGRSSTATCAASFVWTQAGSPGEVSDRCGSARSVTRAASQPPHRPSLLPVILRHRLAGAWRPHRPRLSRASSHKTASRCETESARNPLFP
jgi:hypothetical protein